MPRARSEDPAPRQLLLVETTREILFLLQSFVVVLTLKPASNVALQLWFERFGKPPGRCCCCLPSSFWWSLHWVEDGLTKRRRWPHLGSSSSFVVFHPCPLFSSLPFVDTEPLRYQQRQTVRLVYQHLSRLILHRKNRSSTDDDISLLQSTPLLLLAHIGEDLRGLYWAEQRFQADRSTRGYPLEL